jgi:hypothetical protein
MSRVDASRGLLSLLALLLLAGGCHAVKVR